LSFSFAFVSLSTQALFGLKRSENRREKKFLTMFHSHDSEEIKMVSEGSRGEKRNQYLPFWGCNLVHLVPFVTDLNQNMEPGMQQTSLKGWDAKQDPLWGEVPYLYNPFSFFSVLFFSCSNTKLLLFS